MSGVAVKHGLFDRPDIRTAIAAGIVEWEENLARARSLPEGEERNEDVALARQMIEACRSIAALAGDREGPRRPRRLRPFLD